MRHPRLQVAHSVSIVFQGRSYFTTDGRVSSLPEA
jgi:hypothetical protein